MTSDERFERILIRLIERLEHLSSDQLAGRDKLLNGARWALAEQPASASRGLIYCGSQAVSDGSQLIVCEIFTESSSPA